MAGRSSTFVRYCARFGVGGNFLWASASKLPLVLQLKSDSRPTLFHDFSLAHPALASAFLVAEFFVGIALLVTPTWRLPLWVAIVLLAGFSGAILQEFGREAPRACGCGLMASFATVDVGMEARGVLLLGLFGNLLLIGFVAAMLRVQARATRPSEGTAQVFTSLRSRSGRASAGGFSFIEVLIVIALIALLVGLIVPAVALSRQHARHTACASNLRQLGVLFQTYSAANHGWVPRYNDDERQADGPLWIDAIGDMLVRSRTWQYRELKDISLLQCPAHPTSGIPTGYILNAFVFRQENPFFLPGRLVQSPVVQNASTLPWLLETPDLFKRPSPSYVFNQIFDEPYHVAYHPSHLPGGEKERVSYTRHDKKGSNLLFFDGHVGTVVPGALKLEQFDPGQGARPVGR